MSARETRYQIRDAHEQLVAVHVRREQGGRKSFTWERPDGTVGLNGVPVASLPLYGSEHVSGWPSDAPTIIVEGEKAADALREHGFQALGTVTGAASNPGPGPLGVVRDRRVILWPDNDEKGRLQTEKLAEDLVGIAANISIFEWQGAPEKGDAADYLDGPEAAARLRHELQAARPWSPAPKPDPAHLVRGNPWVAIQTAPEFLSASEPDGDFLEPRVLARGSVTLFMSPRGLGKTHVAHAVAVRLARAGRRILIIDRDNSRRELKRRLRGWGAADLPNLEVLGRDDARPLTDRQAWAVFPFADYDLAVIDSLDASTEGVGDQDSAKPSLALASVLDIAHRAAGPAILILGNTVKSGSHGRGSGVVEDRADIVFEVRDATDLRPSGTKEWWLELPPADRGSWADRAARRKHRETYRLAFVPSKYRIGEEPDPFVLEVRLPDTEPWTCMEVTPEVVSAGEQAIVDAKRQKAAHLANAVATLRDQLGAGLNLNDEAVPLLVDLGLPRRRARALIAERAGCEWRIEGSGRKGDPRMLLALVTPFADGSTAGMQPLSQPLEMQLKPSSIPAEQDPCGRQESTLKKAASDTGAKSRGFLPSDPSNTTVQDRGGDLLDLLERQGWEPVADAPSRADDAFAPPTAPCRVCRCSSFWRHRAGGGFICDRCHPAPSEAVVAERLEVRA